MTVPTNKPEFFTVYQGEDRSLPMRLINFDVTPYNCSGVTEIRVRFKASSGGVIEKRYTRGDVTIVDSALGRITVALTQQETRLLQTGERLGFTVIADKGAFATVVASGITYKADLPSADGNLIVLVFNGVATVQNIVDLWNENNPTNPVNVISGSTSTVPSSSTVTLVGGTNGRRTTNFERAITVKSRAV